MITYKEIKGRRGSWEIRVRLDGKWTGSIRLVEGGFCYFPKGVRKGVAGELFKTVREVQRDLEPDEFCKTCGVSLTTTDTEAGYCTNCKTTLKG